MFTKKHYPTVIKLQNMEQKFENLMSEYQSTYNSFVQNLNKQSNSYWKEQTGVKMKGETGRLDFAITDRTTKNECFSACAKNKKCNYALFDNSPKVCNLYDNTSTGFTPAGEKTFNIKVGSGGPTKVVQLPEEGLKVSPDPVNAQNPNWSDRFSVSVNGRKLTVKRLDQNTSWGQTLVLKATKSAGSAVGWKKPMWEVKEDTSYFNSGFSPGDSTPSWKYLGDSNSVDDCNRRALKSEHGPFSSVVYGDKGEFKNNCYGGVVGGQYDVKKINGMTTSIPPGGTTRFNMDLKAVQHNAPAHLIGTMYGSWIGRDEKNLQAYKGIGIGDGVYIFTYSDAEYFKMVSIKVKSFDPLDYDYLEGRYIDYSNVKLPLTDQTVTDYYVKAANDGTLAEGKYLIKDVIVSHKVCKPPDNWEEMYGKDDFDVWTERCKNLPESLCESSTEWPNGSGARCKLYNPKSSVQYQLTDEEVEDTLLLDKLIYLNAEMKSLVDEMSLNIKNVEVKGKMNQQVGMLTQRALQEKAQQLMNDRTKLMEASNNLGSLEEKRKDTHLGAEADKYILFGLTILAISILGITVKELIMQPATNTQQ